MFRTAKVKFTGGLNKDYDPRSVQPDQYVDAWNVLMGGANSGGVDGLVVEPGNELVEFTLPDGTNKCIGSIPNTEDQTIIYFVYNSNEDHCILEFDPSSSSVSAIFYPGTPGGFNTDFLAFTEDESIHSGTVVDGQLLFTSSVNGPRHIDIQRAKNFGAGVSWPAYGSRLITGSTEERQYMIAAIKIPPGTPPSASYGSDASTQANHLTGKLYQFRYRYVYWDGSKSVFSPASAVPTPTEHESTGGLYQNIQNIENYISVGFNTGGQNVAHIEIAFRDSPIGQWYLLNYRISKYTSDGSVVYGSDITSSINWYGDAIGPAVPDVDLINYDDIPHTAEAQEYLSDNRLIYGNYTKGYDLPDVNANMGYTNEALWSTNPSGFDGTDGTPSTTRWIYGSNAPTVSGSSNAILTPEDIGDVALDDIIEIIYVCYNSTSASPSARGIFRYRIGTNATDTVSLSALAANVSAELDKQDAVSSSTFTQGSRYGVKITSSYTYEEIVKIEVYSKSQKEGTCKRNATHQFGIYYSDGAGRHSAVYTDNTMRLYVPSLIDEDPGTAYSSALSAIKPQMTIWNEAPSWARYYTVCYGGSDVSFWIQGIVNDVPYKTELDDSGSEVPGVLNLYAPEFFEKIVNSNMQSYRYEFQRGDRLRFITDSGDAVLTDELDVEVLSIDSARKTIQIQAADLNSYDIGRGSMFEIYRRTTTDLGSDVFVDLVSYEISGGEHLANTQNQDRSANQGAIVTLDVVDCYYIGRLYHNYMPEVYLPEDATQPVELSYVSGVSYPTTYPAMESMHFSDFYESNFYGHGRQNVYNLDLGQEYYPNFYQFGGKYFQGTQTNNMFRFNAFNEGQLSVEHGAINKLIQIGFTLKVLQDHRLTSIYINRRIVNYPEDPNKRGEIVATQETIGDSVPSPLKYGTQHPESVVRKDRKLYFYDQSQGAFCMDSSNGVHVISGYFMSRFFRELSSELGGQSVVCGVDEYNDRILVTIGTTTLSYFDPDQPSSDPAQGRWVAQHSYVPSRYGNVGNSFVSFSAGKLYLHNYGSELKFYDILAEASVTSSFREEENSVKNWLSLWVNASSVWHSEDQGDVYTLDGDMETRILGSKYSKREQVYYAMIPRDMNTPGMGAIVALMSGRSIKSRALLVKFRNDGPPGEKIYSVEAKYSKSEMTT